MMRIQQFLNDQHVPFEEVLHPPAYTAQQRAKCLHVPGKRLAKCVLLRPRGSYLLAVLPATHQVDMQLLCQELGDIRLADAEEVAEVFCDCEYGVLTPFGTLYGLRTIIDDALDPEEIIVFEADLHAMTIRMRCKDYERLEKPRRFRFARRSAP